MAKNNLSCEFPSPKSSYLFLDFDEIAIKPTLVLYKEIVVKYTFVLSFDMYVLCVNNFVCYYSYYFTFVSSTLRNLFLNSTLGTYNYIYY